MILFLDFDGVLHPVNGRAFMHVPALAAALDGSDVQIVISSSYREHHPAEHLIKLLGPLGHRVMGVTPSLSGKCVRQREIEAWIADHGAREYIVLDDDASLFSPNWGPLVLCEPNVGLNKAALTKFGRLIRRPRLNDMLAAFDKDRHGGEVMAFAPVGKEVPGDPDESVHRRKEDSDEHE